MRKCEGGGVETSPAQNIKKYTKVAHFEIDTFLSNFTDEQMVSTRDT